MTDPEIQEVLDRIDDVRTAIEELQEHPMIEGYRAEEGLDEALEGVEVAYTDVSRGE